MSDTPITDTAGPGTATSSAAGGQEGAVATAPHPGAEAHPAPAAPGGHDRSARTWQGPDARTRLAILRRAKSVAIVGASPNPARSSYFVATYLTSSTPYRVYFVNPRATEILGRKVYPDLASLPEVPDIVDVFRKGSDIPSVIDVVLAVGAKTIWVQLGIWNEDAARYGESKGLTVVMDRCIKIEHARFHGGLHLMGFNTGQITARKTIR
jgi:uncharacterized protein